MVRGEEDLLVCHPQADLTRGMAGGSNDLQGIFPHGEPVPVLQGLVIGQVQVRTQGPGRVGAGGDPQLLRGKALLEKPLVNAAPVFLLPGPAGEGIVPPPDIDGAPWAHHLRGQPGVVGVNVGEQHIQGIVLRPGGPQPCLESLAARGLPEARVNEQASLPPPDQIGIELPQGVAGQGNGQAKQPRQQLQHPVGPMHIPQLLDSVGPHPCFRASPTRALAPRRSAPSAR